MKKYSTKFNFRQREIIALIAGAILPLAFAPFSLYPVAFISFALLLFCWLETSPKRSFLLGALFGISYFGIGVSWIFVSLHIYGGASIFFAGLATVLFVLLFTLYPAIQGYVLNRFFSKNNLAKYLLVFPASWVLLEWIRSWLFSGFPWLLVGYSQTNSLLRGWAPLFGVYGISLITLIISACLFGIFYFRKLATRILLIGIIFIFFCGGLVLTKIHWTKPIGKPIKISLVQGNIPQELKWRPEEIQAILKTYIDLTAAHWDSDIIVWPECAIIIPNINAKDFLQQLNQIAKSKNAALISGIPIYQNFQYYNGAVALGKGSGVYLKHHLVPFGEYIPLRSFFEIFRSFVQIPMSDFGSGSAKQPNLIAQNVPIAPYICYEIIFPIQVANDLPQAQLLLLITDDSWFGDSFAPAQHLQMGQMRALETGRYLLFSSNSGITAFINAQGHIQSKAPSFEKYVLTDNAQPMQGSTPFVWWKNYPVYLIILLFLIFGWYKTKK